LTSSPTPPSPLSPRSLPRRAIRWAFQWLRDLTVRRKLSLLVGILVLNLATVISLSILGMSILSQVRAYVGGEGLWAKAQKNAVYCLAKYAHSRQERDYQEYLGYLKTPLGDRQARLELSKPHPDLNLSDQGFLEGQNHPADVRGMAQLFRRFHGFHQIHRAIEIWTRADTALLELQDLGGAFQALTPAQRARPAQVDSFIRQLDEINGRLTLLENDFSLTMGAAARWARNLLEWVMIVGSLSVGLLSLAIALYFGRTIVSGLTRIGAAASRAAEGDLGARVALNSTDELGHLAQAFNAMTESLARIDQVKSDFVATVSHELRTPLTLILAPLESLLSRDYGALPPNQEAVLGTMDNNARRLLQMVNGLLDFSKLQAGKMSVALQPTDIVGLTRSVLKDLEPAMRRKGLGFEADLGAENPVIEMDAYLFERILFNLLSNAMKFTPAGGRVRLELAYQAPQLRLTVSDNGIGISEADAKNLFKKFSQAEASSTRRFEGTGLGLALVKECALLLGGDVSLQSRPGQGSVFSVACPAPLSLGGARPLGLPAPARVQGPDRGLAAEPPAETASDGPATLPKVLIAEDNPELAAFIAAILKGIGQVRVRPDGVEALQEARSWRPDLILSDVMMANLDGIALTRALKGGLETASIPVILLTALTSQADLLRGWEAGADDYLFKPFHPRELQARVRSLLAMAAWRQRSEQQRQRQEVLEQFTRIASHDLKAPLRRMASYAGLLLRSQRDKLDDEALAHLRVIADGAQQMNALIESLLQFSRLDSGESAFRTCDLRGTMVEVAQFLAPVLEEKSAQLDIGPLPRLDVIPEQVFALLQNLVSNSLKYAHPNLKPRIAVGAELQGHAWLFWVRDNGLGFDPALKDEVFVLFRRLQQDPSIPGEGMGLAIAKKIVELHGGRIWAEPLLGQGCTIYFTLLAERPGKQGLPA
jgi:signal transduction histidine kinase